MTVCVGVVVNDCLVFAADSAATVVSTDPNGSSQIVNVYQHGDKVYNLHRRLPIVAMTCGMGNIGTASISIVAKELRQKLMNGDSDWRIDPENYTVREIAD